MSHTDDFQHPNQPARLLVGCAGWTIPGADRDAFPSEGSHLEKFARVLSAVEINSSFYRPHRPETYARWADCVPAQFRFSVKLPRSITHDAKLRDIAEPLRDFASQAGALGSKLGCVLVQLPPKLGFDPELAGEFFARLKETFSCTIACEARHPEWFADGASELLERQGITRVIADPPKGQDGPHRPTTDTIYVRLHGAPRIYYSSYGDDYLDELACNMLEHARAGRTVWTIFDNTASGASVPNALRVQGVIAKA
ncbi:MAG: DUF72 domain-containing protein [Pseudomonadota bacterium]